MKLCAEISKKEGNESIFGLGSKSAVLKVPRWSTGITDLDAILGGGMPEGRIIELFGAESSGKTSLAYHLCAQHEICLHTPIEGTFEKERAELFGNRPKQMLVYNKCKYGEQAFNKMIKFAENGIPLEILDSVPAMQPKEDIEKIKKAVNADKETELRVGGIATLMNKYLPTLNDIIECTGTTVIFINQIRDKIGVLSFGDNISTPGGHSLKHYCSIRIQVARKGWIEIPNHNPSNSAANEKIGLIMKCRTVKNKTAPPMQECEIPLFFERGFVEFADMERVRKEIMEEHRKRYKEMLN
uniref:Protein recA n=1 Tax=Dulem virus 36 TaxID=3145754 RepID=A0AAU8AYH0_9CAUD